MASVMRFDEWQDSNGNPVYDGSRGALPIGRNLLYNGAMQVAQRGTSETSITTSGYYTADRWNLGLSSFGTWTETVEADGPTGSGFTKSFKLECTTADAAPAAGDFGYVYQRLEGQDLQGLKKGTSSAESLTLSFWVKSNVTGTYVVGLLDADNTRLISSNYTVASSGTWEKKTVTFAGDTTGALDNDNALSLQLEFWMGAGSNFTSGSLQTSWATTTSANRAVGQTNLAAATSNYWQVTGVQLETGTTASSFEHKAYGTELAECQRYYYKISTSDTGPIGYATEQTTNLSRGSIPVPTTMRATPSVSYSGTVNIIGEGYSASVTAISGLSARPNDIQLNMTNVTERTGIILAFSGQLEANAEL